MLHVTREMLLIGGVGLVLAYTLARRAARRVFRRGNRPYKYVVKVHGDGRKTLKRKGG